MIYTTTEHTTKTQTKMASGTTALSTGRMPSKLHARCKQHKKTQDAENRPQQRNADPKWQIILTETTLLCMITSPSLHDMPETMHCCQEQMQFLQATGDTWKSNNSPTPIGRGSSSYSSFWIGPGRHGRAVIQFFVSSAKTVHSHPVINGIASMICKPRNIRILGSVAN